MVKCYKICEIYRDKRYCRADKKCDDCRHYKIACSISGEHCPVAKICPNESLKQQMEGGEENG